MIYQKLAPLLPTVRAMLTAAAVKDLDELRTISRMKMADLSEEEQGDALQRMGALVGGLRQYQAETFRAARLGRRSKYMPHASTAECIRRQNQK